MWSAIYIYISCIFNIVGDADISVGCSPSPYMHVCMCVYCPWLTSFFPSFPSWWQLYTIPPIRSGILVVEEAAKEFVVLEEQEKEREEREREERERKRRERMSTNDVGGIRECVLYELFMPLSSAHMCNEYYFIMSMALATLLIFTHNLQ